MVYLVVFLMLILLFAVSLIAYSLGAARSTVRAIRQLREHGWRVEPPDIQQEAADEPNR